MHKSLRILFLFVIYFFLIKRNNKLLKISVIVKINYGNFDKPYSNNIDKYFIITNSAAFNIDNSSNKYHLICHNMITDDILFLMPLYSILINTNIVAICNGMYNNEKLYYNYYHSLKSNYSIYKNCIYFSLYFIKLLHIHTNAFKNCTFIRIYKLLETHIYDKIFIRNICCIEKYSTNYSIVTTLFRRNNTYYQIELIRNQSVPPNHIIVVHDRNFINFKLSYTNVLYIHTVNFQAGFYFRYLISLLSPEENIIIYDDDQNPTYYNSHYLWINNIIKKRKGIYSNRIGNMRKIKWCATPLIIKKQLLYIAWINDIYEPTQAEDGHLSFSVLMLCNISCSFLQMKGLKTAYDKLSSPRKKLIYNFWHRYIDDTINKINSNYTKRLKERYSIF